MSLSIGLQLYSVRNALAQDFVGTLEKVAALGYRNLELLMRVTDDGLSLGGDMTPAELKQLLDSLGMQAVSCHTRVKDEAELERVIAANHVLGNTAIGWSIAFFSNTDDVLRFCEAFNRYGELCSNNGQQLYYHNHFQEFQVFEGQTVMDLMLDRMDENLVKFELDTYWATRGDVDPVAWLHKLGDRCDLIHQKDIPTSAQPVNLFDVFGAGGMITLEQLNQTQDPSHFTEIGEGTMDIPAIIQAARDLGYARYIFVEQDMSSRDELESIAISQRNLERMLSSA